MENQKYQTHRQMDDHTANDGNRNIRIDIHRPHEVERWAKELGITLDELRKAVEKAGVMLRAVRAYLSSNESK